MPGWQKEFDIFGSVFHSIVGFENDVHVHEHVNVDEDVIVDVHVFVDVDGFGCDQASLRGPQP